MYTRCPDCATVFRVTAEQLRMAHGDVRCGNCGISFNALLSLMDERPAGDAVAPPGDSIETEPDEAVSAAPEDESVSAPADVDNELEFDAPEQSWSRFFMSADSGTPPVPTPRVDETAAPEPMDEPDEEHEPIDEQTGEHEEWRIMLADLEEPADEADDDPTNEHPIITVEETPGDDGEDDATEHEEPQWVLERVAESRDVAGQKDGAAPITQFDYGDYVENVVLEGDGEITEDAFEQAALPPWISEERLEEAFPEPVEKASRRWYAAAALLTVLLGLQWLHISRDALAASPSIGGAVRSIYGLLGAPLYPHWDLDAFEVTASDAVAGRTSAEALDVVAEIAVRSEEPIGLPLVRVVLRDRWSNPVANRVFEPAEYVAGARATPDTVSPGAKIPIEISVDDPGSDALGYLVDICLPHRKAGLICQLERDPFVP